MNSAAYQDYHSQPHQQNVGNRYQETEINTADPLNLVLILYRGASQHLKRSLECFLNGCIEKRTEAINKAGAMIGELQSTLDFEKGQPIAGSLDRLYSYMQQRLLQGSMQQDPSAVEEVIKLLETLASAWEEIQASKEQSLLQGERVKLSA